MPFHASGTAPKASHPPRTGAGADADSALTFRRLNATAAVITYGGLRLRTDEIAPPAPWQTRTLPRPGGGTITVTGVPVRGFTLSAAGLPTVYVSGATVSLDVVRTIVDRLGSAPIAALDGFAGAPAREAAALLGARLVLPGDAEPGLTIVDRPVASQRLLIVGGTCLTGFAIAREALARGHHVTVFGRSTDHADALRYADVVVADPLAAPPDEVARGHDAIVSAISGQCEDDPRMIFALAAWLLQVAEAVHVPRLLWVAGAADPDEIFAQAQAREVLRFAQTPVLRTYLDPPAEPIIDFARAAVDELERPTTTTTHRTSS
jgi:hypothetical protein